MRRTVLQVVLVQHSFVLKGWETFEVPPDDGLPWIPEENRAPDTFPARNNYS